MKGNEVNLIKDSGEYSIYWVHAGSSIVGRVLLGGDYTEWQFIPFKGKVKNSVSGKIEGTNWLDHAKAKIESYLNGKGKQVRPYGEIVATWVVMGHRL
jgi:hypothetical protein